jgi:hypothetical protein
MHRFANFLGQFGGQKTSNQSIGCFGRNSLAGGAVRACD